MTKFTIQTKLDYFSFLSGSLNLLYSSEILRLASLTSILFIVLFFLFKNQLGSDFMGSWILLLLFAGSFFVLLFFPSLVLLMTVIQYKSDKRLREAINYEFSEADVLVTGESFNSRFDWNNLHKIKVTKRWVYLYQNKMIANFIKLDSSVENLNMAEFRQFLIERK